MTSNAGPPVIDPDSTRHVDVAGAAGGDPFGAVQGLDVTPGVYEVRVFGGAVAVKGGAAPIARKHLIVVQTAPLYLLVRGSRMTFAGADGAGSRVYVSRCV